MNAKARLCASAAGIALATVALATVTPATAQISGATPNNTQAGGQDLPKPTTASDQNANPAAPQPSLQESPTEGDGEIVVTGLRRSLQSAQAIKRNSDGIVDAIERVTDKFVTVREPGERFLDTYRRVGFETFKEAIYG